MPRIPTYQQQSTANATLSPRSLDTGGQDVVRGLAVLGQGAERAGRSIKYVQEVDQRKQEADSLVSANLELSKAPAKFDQWTIDSVNASEGDPTGFTERGLKAFDEYAPQALATAKTEKAKQFMQLHLAEMRGRYQSQWMQWEAKTGVERRGTQAAEAGENLRKVVRTDPSRFEDTVTQMAVVLNNAALPKDVRDKIFTNFKEDTARDAVFGMVEKNPSKTAALLRSTDEKTGNAAIDALSPEARNQLILQADAQIEHQRAEAERAVDRSMANMLVGPVRGAVMEMPVNSAGMVDLEAAKAYAVSAARKRYGNIGAEQLLRIENYVEGVARDREQGVQRAHQASLATGMDALEQNGYDFEQLKTTHPEVVAGLDRAGMERLNNFAVVGATGGYRATDSKTYNQLVEDPALLVATNIDAMKDRFNSREFEQLSKIRNGLISDPGSENNVRDTGTLLKERLDSAGFGKHDEEKKARFYSMLQVAVDQEVAATGKKKLTQAQTLALADNLLVEVITSKGALWDSHGPAFTIEVPPEERSKIILSMMANGVPATEYNIAQAYREKLNKGAQ